MDESIIKKQSSRLISLDAFRGITIAMMILVNNPGTWSAVYPQLRHATWNGWTITDFIFPFFLFIVGVSIVFAFSKRLESGRPKRVLYLKILRRTLILFGLGLFLNGFSCIPQTIFRVWGGLFILSLIILVIVNLLTRRKDQHLKALLKKITKNIFKVFILAFVVIAVLEFDFSNIRIPGVLQRIAVTYAIAAIVVLNTNRRVQFYISVGLVLGYWATMKLIPVPGYGAGILEPMGNLCWYVDSKLLSGHTWVGAPVEGFDPEGILSTIPAIATVLFGVLTGHWLRTKKDQWEKVTMLFVFGISALVIGEFISMWFPINKNLWSSSYTVFMAGMALLFLGMCYWLVDIKHYEKWTKPFIILGSNAITVYALSSFFARVFIYCIKITTSDGGTISLKSFLYKTLFESWISPINASFFYALFYLLIWLLVAWIMYRKKVFIKV